MRTDENPVALYSIHTGARSMSEDEPAADRSTQAEPSE